MHARWKIMTAALCAAFAAVAASADAAEIAFASRSDFTEISLNIRDTYNANPDQIVLDVTLSQEAQQRMLAATTAALEQDLTLLIDGKPVSTTHVKNAIDAPQLQISMSRQLAIDLLPNLLGVSNGSNPSAIPPAMPSAAAATMPAAAGNPEPLFPAPPVEAQPQQVVPPTVSDSAQEAAAAMPEPGAAMPPMLPMPAVPPDLGAAPAAEPTPSAAPQEAIMAPAVAAVESPAPPLPLVPALPQVPRWASGAWLPTSATPSPYAEIYPGDAITISAHGVNALACNQARTRVLASGPQQVRLEIDQGSACVINQIPVGQLRISPSATPGKIVISLYSPGDDMDGAPAKEGSYQRKP